MPADKSPVFLPLGGTGEIGMNCNLYGVENNWIMVDLGVTFSKGDNYGIDLIMPDLSFIEEVIARGGRLHGLFLTHGHEDHIGAVAHLWDRLQCPIYATPFTAELVRHKLEEKNINAPLHVIDINAHIEAGPFNIDYITLTHSIAESSALAIRVGDANILHTGDWKIDPNPLIGSATQHERLKAFGDEGIDAIICDSTNALEEGRAGSEAEVAVELKKTISACKKRVVVTSFASNIARLASVAEAARATNRALCLLGYGMHRMMAAAQNVGYLQNIEIIDEETAASTPRENLLILCTGSQGEAQAALARLAHDSHSHLSLSAGDTVIFSSRKIPGNEINITALQNQLIARDIKINTSRPLHVSGHPCRDELRDMYQWTRPRLAIPVHGEARHLQAHAQLARSLDVPQAMQIRNGDMVRLTPNPLVVEKTDVGRLYLDGNLIITAENEALAKRRKFARTGLVSIAIPIQKNRLVGEIDITLHGIPASENFIDEIEDAISRKIPASGKLTPARAEQEIRRAVREIVKIYWGKRPQISLRFIEIL